MTAGVLITRCKVYSDILGEASPEWGALMIGLNKYGVIIALILVAVIIACGVTAWAKYSPGQTIEISLPPQPEIEGTIYVGGAVSNPGFYPLVAGDKLEDIIGAAGGISSGADLDRLKLYVSVAGEEEQPQKIDINCADAWLLQALPGIGETRAQAIVEYRKQFGPFHSTLELTRVKGIGSAIYEQIKHLITVAE